MILLTEDPNLILQRKYRNILEVCGKGAILFAAWSVVKGLMYIFLGDNLVREVNNLTAANNISPTVLITFAAVLILLELFLHLRIAVMALREAKGKTAGILPLIITGLLILYSLYGIYATITGEETARYLTIEDRIVTCFVEFTSVLNMAEILIYSIRLRRLPASAGTNPLNKEDH